MAHGLRGSAVTQRGVAVVLAVGVAFLGLSLPDRAYAATADKITPAVVAAGSGIAIAGTELTGTTGVTFLGGEGAADDVDATHFVVVDSKKIAVQVPAEAATGPVALTSDAGTIATAVPAAIVHAPVID